MRLLSKKEVDIAKVADKRREYDEGAKLASRVDVLRKTAVEEERNLTKVREASVLELRAVVSPLEKKKGALLDEVHKLEVERKRLLEPITERENAVRNQEMILASKVETLNEDKVRLATKGGLLQIKEEELRTEQERIKDERNRTADSLSKAEELRKDAQLTLYESRQKGQEILSNLELREKGLKIKEGNVAARERDVVMQQDQLQKEWDQIEAQKVLLADRNAMVERTLKQLHGTHK